MEFRLKHPMVKRLGYVAHIDNGDCGGVLNLRAHVSMSGLKCANVFKMPRSQSPNYYVFGETYPEVGGARNGHK